MSNTMINMQRIELLIQGEQPDGLEEELFVLACKLGLGGEPLKELMWQVSGEYHNYSHVQKDYMYLGYMLGQDMYLEANEETDNKLNAYKKLTH